MWKRNLTVVAMLALSWTAGAADNVGNISFDGTLQEPPPCTINSGGEVDVDFGSSVGVNSVDGVNNRIAVNYSLSCTAAAGNPGTLTLTLLGTKAGFDEYALQTDMEDLGVRIYQGSGDTLLKPDVGVAITLSSPPSLEAVLVKKSGSTLAEGSFVATATLKAEYL